MRGIVLGVLATAAMAALLGYSAITGALFGLASLSGDLLSSFLKRRMHIAPSSMALGLDQIPEALLPLWLLREALGLDLGTVIIITGLFTVGELLLSRVMYWIGVRDHPY